MANFTVEINRGQDDTESLSTDRTSSSGLAFTYTFNWANATLTEGESPYTSEAAYLKSLLLRLLKSWRKTQLDVGVREAYAAADESTKSTVRTTLGL